MYLPLCGGSETTLFYCSVYGSGRALMTPVACADTGCSAGLVCGAADLCFVVLVALLLLDFVEGRKARSWIGIDSRQLSGNEVFKC